jgi:hypothetical protein
MTDNDITQQPYNGQWVQVDPKSSAGATPQPQAVTLVRAVEDTPATTGIVLDQKVLIPLILLLGVIAGIVIMLVMDKYSSKREERHPRFPSE